MVGKVPVLIHGDRIMAESEMISWYLAEEFKTGTDLIPKDTLQRARVRYFTQIYPPKLYSSFHGFLTFHKKSEEKKKQLVDKTVKYLEEIENIIEGPYLFGESFTLADVALYPWL